MLIRRVRGQGQGVPGGDFVELGVGVAVALGVLGFELFNYYGFDLEGLVDED